ncbi:hypothetical protein HJFPF1_05520 [Paramyrothecium foliicola]|nr:hypothetical protein HJFPF1_05520 [Paramyrothecium foliicola]
MDMKAWYEGVSMGMGHGSADQTQPQKRNATQRIATLPGRNGSYSQKNAARHKRRNARPGQGAGQAGEQARSHVC